MKFLLSDLLMCMVALLEMVVIKLISEGMVGVPFLLDETRSAPDTARRRMDCHPVMLMV